MSATSRTARRTVAQLRVHGAPLGSVCHFCRHSFESADDGVLVLFGAQNDGFPCYPRGGAVALLTHFSCGPDVGYNIQLSRIAAVGDPHSPDTRGDTLSDWLRHLEGKRWYSPALAKDLVDAHLLASALPRSSQSPRDRA